MPETDQLVPVVFHTPYMARYGVNLNHVTQMPITIERHGTNTWFIHMHQNSLFALNDQNRWTHTSTDRRNLLAFPLSEAAYRHLLKCVQESPERFQRADTD